MTDRDTRRAFLNLLDQTWPGVRSEFVAAMKQAQAGVDMNALEAAIARGDVDAAFRALRFDAADLFRTDTAITAAFAAGTLSGTPGTAVPNSTTLIGPWGYRTNNATALAVGLDVASAYIETDS
jgi:hypothetical protein